ncbi:hypothetical protein WLQ65_22630 [Pseudoalteromonas piscicida]|uniref:hypothetical protein n=1 Tax=Pseudoalteromonas piscicida TaxID=43662 RepID=UPI0030C9C130
MFNFLTPMEFYQQEVLLPFKYDIAITSQALDPRGEVSQFNAEKSSKRIINITYDHNELTLSINGVSVGLIDFLSQKSVFSSKSILFDATNLSFAEIAIVMRLAIKTMSIERASFLYTEPEKYSAKVWSPLEARSFNLSNRINLVDFIPTFYQRSLSSKKNYLLAFLGFEDIRLAKALDPDNGTSFDNVSIVFSIPPFQAGWETHALMANSRVLKEHVIEESFFTAGNQPYDAYNLIEKVISTTKNGYNSNLTLAPFGTKPTSIAAALAAAKNEDISVLFDFPEKSINRSQGVGKLHYYPISISGSIKSG